MKKRILSLLLVVVMIVSILASCGEPPVGPDPDPTPELKLEYADGTILRMATGYNNAKTGLFFDAEIAKDGITLADGKTYNTGDLKPTWVEVQNRLNVAFENHYQGKSAKDEFEYWKAKLADIDMVSGTASQLSEAGVAGDLALYQI